MNSLTEVTQSPEFLGAVLAKRAMAKPESLESEDFQKVAEGAIDGMIEYWKKEAFLSDEEIQVTLTYYTALGLGAIQKEASVWEDLKNSFNNDILPKAQAAKDGLVEGIKHPTVIHVARVLEDGVQGAISKLQDPDSMTGEVSAWLDNPQNKEMLSLLGIGLAGGAGAAHLYKAHQEKKELENQQKVANLLDIPSTLIPLANTAVNVGNWGREKAPGVAHSIYDHLPKPIQGGIVGAGVGYQHPEIATALPEIQNDFNDVIHGQHITDIFGKWSQRAGNWCVDPKNLNTIAPFAMGGLALVGSKLMGAGTPAALGLGTAAGLGSYAMMNPQKTTQIYNNFTGWAKNQGDNLYNKFMSPTANPTPAQ